MIPIQYALRRRMMINVSKGLPISELPLGALIRIADSDGGSGAANYEIADINNLVSGGVVLVRKNIHSESLHGGEKAYPNSTLDNKMTSIYNSYSEKLRNKITDVTFSLHVDGRITRKVFALTYTMAGYGKNNNVTEGKAFQLYTSNDARIKTFNNKAATWWLSSRDYSTGVRTVTTVGTVRNGLTTSTDIYGVVPAFVISVDAAYDPTPNDDGSYDLIY